VRSRVCVEELTWGDRLSRELLDPPVDLVLAADCAYNECIVPDLCDTLASLSGPHTWLVLAQELRSSVVHECFLDALLRYQFKLWRMAMVDSGAVVVYLAKRAV